MTTKASLPPTSRQKMIAAAISRGIAVSRVARNSGMTMSAVEACMRAFREKTGADLMPRRPRPNYKPKRPAAFGHCAACKAPFRFPRPGMRRMFCSVSCQMTYQVKLRDAEVVAVIERRKNGETWTGIARTHGVMITAVQCAVWQFLRRQGLLTWETVRSVWRPAPGLHNRSFSVKHLEKRYGAIGEPESGADTSNRRGRGAAPRSTHTT